MKFVYYNKINKNFYTFVIKRETLHQERYLHTLQCIRICSTCILQYLLLYVNTHIHNSHDRY